MLPANCLIIVMLTYVAGFVYFIIKLGIPLKNKMFLNKLNVVQVGILLWEKKHLIPHFLGVIYDTHDSSFSFLWRHYTGLWGTYAPVTTTQFDGQKQQNESANLYWFFIGHAIPLFSCFSYFFSSMLLVVFVCLFWTFPCINFAY